MPGTKMQIIAAVPDAWIVGIGIVQLVWSAIVSVAIFRLGVAQRRYDALEERINKATERQISGLESGLETALGDGHKLELKILQGLAEIKTFVVERAATKDDLKEHQRRADERADRTQSHLAKQDQKLAEIEATIKVKSGK